MPHDHLRLFVFPDLLEEADFADVFADDLLFLPTVATLFFTGSRTPSCTRNWASS